MREPRQFSWDGLRAAGDGEGKGQDTDPRWGARSRVHVTGIRRSVAEASRKQEAKAPLKQRVLSGRGK